MEAGEPSAPEDVPVQMEHRLTCRRPDVDDHTVVVKPGACGGLGDETQHPPRLLVREGIDLTQGIDVPGRQDEQVSLGRRSDVPDRHEALGGMDMIACDDKPAEQAVIGDFSRQRRPPPRP